MKNKTSKAELAKHIDLSTRQFRSLVEQGVFGPAPPGGYTLDHVRITYIRRQREVAAGRAGRSGEADLAVERAQLASAQRARVELQTKILRHEFIDSEEAARQLGEVMAIVREHFATLGIRCVPDLLALVTIPAGREPEIASAMAEVVQRYTDACMRAFRDFNESGGLAELLAPTTTEAAK
jgi:hypothetical protein